jgi:ATP/maltotriose-dependent transcriptional regulator MalT
VPPRPGAQQLDDPLSERELEVLELLASGHTNAEIARALFVAIGTVKSHTGNIYRKLDAKNRVEALGRARELKLLP